MQLAVGDMIFKHDPPTHTHTRVHTHGKKTHTRRGSNDVWKRLLESSARADQLRKDCYFMCSLTAVYLRNSRAADCSFAVNWFMVRFFLSQRCSCFLWHFRLTTKVWPIFCFWRKHIPMLLVFWSIVTMQWAPVVRRFIPYGFTDRPHNTVLGSTNKCFRYGKGTFKLFLKTSGK